MKWLLYIMFFCFGLNQLLAQADSLSVMPDTSNKVILVQHKPFALTDTIRNTAILRKVFFANERLAGVSENLLEKEFDRQVPGVKQVQIRPEKQRGWKFLVLLGVIFLIGVIRLINIKRFDEIVGAIFTLNYSQQSWASKGSNYLLTAIELFLVFISVISLFVVSYGEQKRIWVLQQYQELFYYIALFFIGMYVAKFVVMFLVSSLFKELVLAKLFFYNTMVINIGLGLILIPLLLVYTYANNFEIKYWASVLGLLVTLIAVVFRQIKNLVLAPTISALPYFYIIIYLCAFEIFPWIIIFKLLIKALQL